MKIEAVLISSSRFKNENQTFRSGILFDGNYVLTSGIIFLAFAQDPGNKPWISLILNASPGFKTDKKVPEIEFQIWKEIMKDSDDVADLENNKLLLGEAILAGYWKCPLVTESIENHFSDWIMRYGDDSSDELSKMNDDVARKLISVLVLLQYDASKNRNELFTVNQSHDVISKLKELLGNLREPIRGEKVSVVSTPFGNKVFLNSLTQGVISNTGGIDKCLILTDARTVVGCEGGPIFSLKKSRMQKDKNEEWIEYKLTGLVISPLSWRRDEWIGLTIGISLKPVIERLLQNKRALLDQDEKFLYALELDYLDEVVVSVNCQNQFGSGVVLDSRTILTCAHVVKENGPLSVTYNQCTFPSKVIFKTPDDSAFDLALIQTEKRIFKKEIKFSEEFPQIGDDVTAVGFPFISGNVKKQLKASMVRGSISHVHPFMIQTTCCIQSGFSGGALLKNGELIGIITANLKNVSAGTYFPHINFVIPISVFQHAVMNYLKTGNERFLQSLINKNPDVNSLWTLNSSKL